MKRFIIMVMAGIMATMLIMTACKSNKSSNEGSTIAFEIMVDNGACIGTLPFTRYGFYGSRAFEACKEAHDLHEMRGEIVTEITEEYVNGEQVWSFKAAKVAG